MWLRDYHVDGLRLDAVHAIVDDVRRPLPRAAGRPRCEALAAELGRPLCLIAESDLNDPRLVRPPRGRRLRPRRAVERRLPPRPARRRSPASGPATTPTSGRWPSWPRRCARPACTTATYSPHRAAHATGARRPGCPAGGSSATSRTTTRSATGRRASGSAHLVSPGRLRMAAALRAARRRSCPMLFQGEEWGASTPFQYFTDHDDPELGRAVTRGPAARVRRLRLGARGRARPAGPGDVRALEAATGTR